MKIVIRQLKQVIDRLAQIPVYITVYIVQYVCMYVDVKSRPYPLGH